MPQEPQYIDKVYARLKADSKGKLTIDAETFKDKFSNEEGYADKVYARLKANSNGKLTISLDEFKNKATVKKKESTDGSTISGQSESSSKDQSSSTTSENTFQDPLSQNIIQSAKPPEKVGDSGFPIPQSFQQSAYENQLKAEKKEIENSVGTKLNFLDLNPEAATQIESEYEKLKKESAGQRGGNLTAAPQGFQERFDEAQKKYNQLQELKKLKDKVVSYEQNKELGVVESYKEYLKNYNKGQYDAITTREERNDEYLNEKFNAEFEKKAIDYASDAITAKYSQIQSAIGFDGLREINRLAVDLENYSKELEDIQRRYNEAPTDEQRNILANQYNAMINDPKINEKVNAYEQLSQDPLYQQYEETKKEYQKLYDYSKSYLEKYPKVVDMNNAIEKQQRDFDEAYRNSSWIAQVSTDVEQASKRVISKLTQDLLTLPRTLSQDNDWGWTDDLAESIDTYVDAYNKLGATTASSGELPLISDVASVDGLKVFLDNKGNPTTVRDKEGFEVDKEVAEEAINKYTESPDSFKISTNEIQGQTLFPKAIKMFGDMGTMYAGAGLATKGLRLIGGTQKFSEVAGLSSSVIGQTHNDAYNTGIENGLSPSEASKYSLAVSAGIALIAQINPQKYLYTKEAGKKFGRDVAKVVLGKSKMGDIKEGVKFAIKEGLKESTEEMAEIPYQSAVGAAANTLTGRSTFDNTQDWNEYAESAVLGFIGGGVFGLGGIKGGSTLQKEAFDYAFKNPEVFNKSVDNMVGKTVWRNGVKTEFTAEMAQEFKSDMQTIIDKSESIYDMAEFTSEEKAEIANLERQKLSLTKELSKENIDENKAAILSERIKGVDEQLSEIIKKRNPVIEGEKVSEIIPEEEVSEEEAPAEETVKEEVKIEEPAKEEVTQEKEPEVKEEVKVEEQPKEEEKPTKKEKPKSKKNDKKDTERVSSPEQKRETTEQKEPIKDAGGKEASASGVLQKQKEVEAPKKEKKKDEKLSAGTEVNFIHLDGSRRKGTIREVDERGRFVVIEKNGQINRVRPDKMLGEVVEGKGLDKAIEKVNELAQTGYEDITTAGVSGGKVKRKRENESEKLSDKIKIEDEEVEKSIVDSDFSMKKNSEGIFTRIKNGLSELFNQASRRYRELEPKRFGREADVLRVFENAGKRSREKANDYVRGLFFPLTAEQKDIVGRAIIFEDMLNGLNEGLETEENLPHGVKNRKKLEEYVEKYQKLLKEEPRAMAAYEARNEFMESLYEELVKYKLIPEKESGFVAYFHRRTLEYMEDDISNKILSGKKLSKSQKDFMKGRTGSKGKAYSTNFIESEAKVVADSLFELEKKKTIEKLMEPYEKQWKELKEKGTEAYQKELDDLISEYGEDSVMAGKFKKSKAHFIENYAKKNAPGGQEYTFYQPEKGNYIFRQTVILPKTVEDLIEELSAEGNEDAQMIQLAEGLIDAAKEISTLGAAKKKYFVPVEIAETLDKLGSPKEKKILLRRIGRIVTGAWKIYKLLNPFRFLKYNLNNTVGDLDGVLAADPTIISKKNLNKAIKDMWDFAYTGKITPEVQKAIDRDVIDSGYDISELNKITEQDWATHLFKERLTVEDVLTPSEWKKLVKAAKSNPVKAYFNFVAKWTGFRENIFRYAAFLRAQERIANGETIYWASNKDAINEIKDPVDKAAKLAREALGDYNNLSEMGQFMRESLMPFYAWTEVNFKRYNNLIRNAADRDVQAKLFGLAATKGVSKLAFTAFIKATQLTMFTMLVSLYNRIFFPDELEEMKNTRIKGLQIITGRDENGEITTIPIMGAFMDYLDWIGVPEIIKTARDIAEGNIQPDKGKDKILKEPFVSILNKTVQGSNPFMKSTFELITGKEVFPDVLNAKPIYNTDEYIANFFDVKDIYKKLKGVPTKKDPVGLNWITKQVNRPIDVKEIIYYEVRNLVGEHSGKFSVTEGDDLEKNEMREAVRNYAAAVRYDDDKQKEKWLGIYLKNGGTKSKLKRSLKAKSPLNSLDKSEERQVKNRILGKEATDEWVKNLTKRELEQIKIALEYYEETFVKAANEL